MTEILLWERIKIVSSSAFLNALSGTSVSRLLDMSRKFKSAKEQTYF